MNLLLMTPLVKQPVRFPNSGLAYLASYVRDLVDSLHIFIPTNDQANEDYLLRLLNTLRPDVVGISLYSLTFSGARKTIDVIKDSNENTLVVLGGPHPSGDPAGTLAQLSKADLCFKGEAEIGFRKLLQSLKQDPNALTRPDILETIPGLAFRVGAACHVNRPALVRDLDRLPLPAYDLMRPDAFLSATGSGYQKSERIGYVTTSRGCVMRCAFCSGHTLSGRKVRLRDPKKVIREIELLVREYGIREIQFTDSDLAHNKAHLTQICNGLVDHQSPVHWSCAACSSSLDDELVLLMRQSGCYMIRIGIETASPRLLKMLHKSVDLVKVKEDIKTIRKVGIRAHGFFMLGFPTETLQDIRTTLRYSYRSGLDSASFAIFQPLPGCELFEKHVPQEQKHLLIWDNFDFYRNAHFQYDVPFSRLKAIQRRAYLIFYLHPRRFLSLLMCFASFAKVRTLLKMIKRNLSGTG